MTTLPLNQHINTAHYFLEKSIREFAEDDELSGSELLWGAAAHALIGVAQQHGWHFDSHGALRNIAKTLADLHTRPQWVTEFHTAERFHTHFYHGRLTVSEIRRDRPQVARFVNRLLCLLVLQ